MTDRETKSTSGTSSTKTNATIELEAAATVEILAHHRVDLVLSLRDVAGGFRVERAALQRQ